MDFSYKGSAVNLYSQLANKIPHNQLQWCEVGVLLLTIAGQFAINHIQDLIDAILQSATEEGRKKHGLSKDYTIFGVKNKCNLIRKGIVQYTALQTKLLHPETLTKDELLNMQYRIFNSVDKAMEMLEDANTSMEDLLKKRCFAKSLKSPQDPQLLYLMLSSLYWLIIVDAVYNHFKTDQLLYLIDQFPSYRFLSMSDIYHRVTRLNDVLDLRSAREPNKRCTFNWKGVLLGDDSLKVMTRIRNILFTTTFRDNIIYVRDNFDPKFRTQGKSVLTSKDTYDIEVYNKYYNINSDETKVG